MAKSSFAKLIKLVKKYQYLLWTGLILFLMSLAGSLLIYYFFEGNPREVFWFQIADVLRNISDTLLTTVLIGGGLGGMINFIFEEQKKEEEAVRERLKGMQDRRDRRRTFRAEMRQRLQSAYDKIELARVLIKSHRSGKTYGEQIRQHIMPANIALQDIKNQLAQMQGDSPIPHLPELQVSLTYMSAYLSVLVEEFSGQYLDIAMLQNYQDTVADRRRGLFADILIEGDADAGDDPRLLFLQHTESHLERVDIPKRLAVVWEAMGRLDYVWDFIADLRNIEGEASRYQTYFIDHHFHCLRLLGDNDNDRNERICRRPRYDVYIAELDRLAKKKKSDQPITKEDSLTRIIMKDGLGFDFEAMEQRLG